jgi:hypothetical protein
MGTGDFGLCAEGPTKTDLSLEQLTSPESRVPDFVGIHICGATFSSFFGGTEMKAACVT